MLILARKTGETIIATVNGVEISITATSVKNGIVTLGFNAPPEVVIDREEVHARKKAGTPAITATKNPLASRGNKALSTALTALLPNPSPREQRELGENVGAALADSILLPAT